VKRTRQKSIFLAEMWYCADRQDIMGIYPRLYDAKKRCDRERLAPHFDPDYGFSVLEIMYDPAKRKQVRVTEHSLSSQTGWKWVKVNV
jgi:hypothetical protein